MSDLRPIPRPDEVRDDIPLYRKPEAKSPTAWLAFVFLRLGRWLCIEAARQAYEDFVQCIDGSAYWYDAPPSESLMAHEAIHVWQEEHDGALRHRWDFVNPFERTGCLHREAMACGLEVAKFGRLAEERARMLVNGPYWLRRDVAEVSALITRYAEKFTAEWDL